MNCLMITLICMTQAYVMYDEYSRLQFIGYFC